MDLEQIIKDAENDDGVWKSRSMFDIGLYYHNINGFIYNLKKKRLYIFMLILLKMFEYNYIFNELKFLIIRFHTRW